LASCDKLKPFSTKGKRVADRVTGSKQQKLLTDQNDKLEISGLGSWKEEHQLIG